MMYADHFPRAEAPAPLGLSNRALIDYAERIAAAHRLPEQTPVNILAVVEAVGGQVTTGAVDSDLLEMVGPHLRIYTLAHTGSLRHRLAIATGLAHYFLHVRSPEQIGKDPAYRIPRGDLGRASVEANIVAAGLLMPASTFRPAWRADPRPMALADQFDVSPRAAAVRAEVLGLPGAAAFA